MGTAEVEAVVPRPPFWLRLSVIQGNGLQLAGLIGGGVLLGLAARPEVGGFQIVLLLAGWSLLYICCHSFAHWLVGRLVGIRFRGYGLRGTDHPEEFGPQMRAVMSKVPMFTVMTDKDSMTRAKPLAKALMFAAGETATILCLLLTGLYAWATAIPGGVLWLILAVGMSLSAVTAPAKMPKGDYAKARRALRGK